MLAACTHCQERAYPATAYLIGEPLCVRHYRELERRAAAESVTPPPPPVPELDPIQVVR